MLVIQIPNIIGKFTVFLENQGIEISEPQSWYQRYQNHKECAVSDVHQTNGQPNTHSFWCFRAMTCRKSKEYHNVSANWELGKNPAMYKWMRFKACCEFNFWYFNKNFPKCKKKPKKPQKQTSTKKIKNHHVLPLYGMTLALGNMGKFVYTGVYFTISAAIAPSAKWQLFPTLLSQNTLVKLSKGCLQKDREQDAKAHQQSTQQLRKRTLAELMDTIWRIYNRTGSICSASQ